MHLLRRTPTGRLLRHADPASARCTCRWPLQLPWRRFRAGAVWECASCGQQWEWQPATDGMRWIALPPEAWIGAQLTPAWQTLLYRSTAD